ncbi:MAG: 4Fe-4S binding protein [Desulfovibrio sp.]|jgi:MauM/NapG family ferredoxin protein|nr:4Fe-4S binding protein [Desulfovibrio sp.]
MKNSPKPFRLAATRRIVRAACLALFCLLLGVAENGGFTGLPADIFLRLDPLAGIAVPLAAREIIVSLIPALGVVLAAVFAGRIFCGWVCPMGTTLDAAGSLVRWKRLGRKTDPVPRCLKYGILAAILAAALLGVNMAFWASPIPLVTRLYALVLHPLGLLGLDGALAVSAPVMEQMGSTDLQYRFPILRGYAAVWFVALFWLGLIALERIRPRFWCRYLCPAGALLGLFSRLAPPFSWKRRTPHSCNACGRCAAQCPAGILHDDPSVTDVSECLTCRACETACKRKSIRFGLPGPLETADGPADGFRSGQNTRTLSRRALSRRAFCGSAAAGAALAGVSYFETAGQALEGTAGKNQGSLIRPPGSVPEIDFLARCVRCGECMKACPTGGLQPAGLQAGFSGMFSPFLDPRSGPCAPDCAACGSVCPSRAIQALPLEEKRWAKIGTAAVDRKLCLAWAEDKRCMVCKETCPYGAVSVVPHEGHIAPVPVVRHERCYGCGFCERHCPTATAAVRVDPIGALRQHDPAFETAAKNAGLELDPSQHAVEHPEYNPQNDGAPPGFLD